MVSNLPGRLRGRSTCSVFKSSGTIEDEELVYRSGRGSGFIKRWPDEGRSRGDR